MADAAAPQPDAEQQPEFVVPEMGTSAVNAELNAQFAEKAHNGQANPVSQVTAEAATPSTALDLEPRTVPNPGSIEGSKPAIPPEPQAIGIPQVASTTDVPASPGASAPEDQGGEWQLLVEKVKHWVESGQLQQQWANARRPLTWLAGFIGLLVALRIYSAVLGVVESLPLLPGLLELVGVISVVRYSLTRLVKSNDRHEVIDGLKQRWSSFRGNR